MTMMKKIKENEKIFHKIHLRLFKTAWYWLAFVSGRSSLKEYHI